MSNKITSEAKEATTAMNHMKAGDLGVTRSGNYVLKLYGGQVVDLRNGDHWQKGCTLPVSVLPPGTIITLEVE